MARRPTFLAVAVLLASGCASSPSLEGCAADSDCGAGNLCHAGACSANAPPAADFAAPTGATTHRLLSVLPALSDPEGRPVEARWSVSPVAEGCAPDPEPQAGPALEVLFWCPGSYAITLVPIDDQGLEGAPVTRTLQIVQAVGAPTVTAGATIEATHRCYVGGSCVVEGPDGSPTLQLGATSADPEGSPTTFEWTGIAPAFATAGTVAITFLTGSDLAAPLAQIVGDGLGPIAGTYRFRVRARDADGLVGQAFQEVAVGNGAPSVAAGPWRVAHRYESGLFVAEGDVRPLASDPDGDLLLVEGSLTPAPPPGCAEESTAAGPGALHVRVACAQATELIGPSPRNLTLTIRDPNGGEASATAPLEIENRPPRISSAIGGALSADHRVEACRLIATPSCFVSEGTDPFVVVDPDGDPVGETTLVAAVGAGQASSAGAIATDATGRSFRFETPTAKPSEFRAAGGETGFSVAIAAADAFGAVATASLPLVIRNRAPVLIEAVPSTTTSHRYDATLGRYLAAAPGPRFEDPDGDPLIPSVSPSGACAAATIDAGRTTILCERAWDYRAGGLPPLQEFLAPATPLVGASDGWEAASSPVSVAILDQAAVVSPASATGESCACVPNPMWPVNHVYVASATNVPVLAELVDPDGDPALVGATSPSYATQPAPVICLPGACEPLVNGASTVEIVGTLTATSGDGLSAQAPFTITPTCALAGGLCFP